jgi:hypothetical protein
MRASDIGGVGGPAATPAPGPSPQRHWFLLLAAPPLGIGGGASNGPASVTYINKKQCKISSIVALWVKPLLIMHLVLGSIPKEFNFFSLCWVKGNKRIFKDIGKALEPKKSRAPQKKPEQSRAPCKDKRINTNDIDGYNRIA